MIEDGQEPITDAQESIEADDEGSSKALSDRPRTIPEGSHEDDEIASLVASAKTAKGSVPLLALDPSRFEDGSRTRTTSVENTGQNEFAAHHEADTDLHWTRLAPLLGTICSSAGVCQRFQNPLKSCRKSSALIAGVHFGSFSTLGAPGVFLSPVPLSKRDSNSPDFQVRPPWR